MNRVLLREKRISRKAVVTCESAPPRRYLVDGSIRWRKCGIVAVPSMTFG